MKERGQVLDLAAPDSELPLAAAVDADPPLGAVVVDGEQVLQRPEAGGLAVDGLGRKGEGLDVGHGVQGRVPGDAVAVGPQHVVGLGHRQVRILEPGLGEGGGAALVQPRVRHDVDWRPPVEALEVEDVDAVERLQLVDEGVGPVVLGIDLEPQGGIDCAALAQGLDGRRVAEPRRGDEPHRQGVALQDRVQGLAGLAQREVEGGALEGPLAVVGVLPAGLRVREQVELVQVGGQRAQGVPAGQRELGAEGVEGVVVGRVVGHVLAHPLRAPSAQANDRRDAGEPPELRFPAVERVVLDRDREIGDEIVGGHDGAH